MRSLRRWWLRRGCGSAACTCTTGRSSTCARRRRGGARSRARAARPTPRFTSWLAAYRKGDWTRDHWYGVDVILHQTLLRSKHRTLDPDAADFFFIPLHLSLGYYSHRYYFKHFTQPAHKPLRDAIRYVKATWPFWARRGGRDHIVVMTQDQGKYADYAYYFVVDGTGNMVTMMRIRRDLWDTSSMGAFRVTAVDSIFGESSESSLRRRRS